MRLLRHIALVMGLIATGLPLLPQERSIVLVTDAEKEGGFLIEIARAAFGKVGYRVKVEYLPWSRALNRTMDGGSEALLGVYYTRERAERMLYSEPIASSGLTFFKLRSSPLVYRNLEDLRGLSVGVIFGAAYTPEFDSATSFRHEPGTDVQMNIRKLLAGRVDLVLEKKGVFLDALGHGFRSESHRIEGLPTPIKETHFYLAISRRHPVAQGRIADFNRGLSIIKREGIYRKILKRNLHE